MINDSKIDRFLQDEAMTSSVFNAIRNSFLRKKGQRDTLILAAERLAVDMLEEAWRELDRYRVSEDLKGNGMITKQVGI